MLFIKDPQGAEEKKKTEKIFVLIAQAQIHQNKDLEKSSRYFSANKEGRILLKTSDKSETN